MKTPLPGRRAGRSLLLLWLLLPGFLGGVGLGRAAGASSAPADAWSEVPKILARIAPPRFPGRDFAVTDHGAVSGGEADCTRAFREAIEACHQSGGGRVVVPPGTYLTGPIHLRSRVNLHLAAGATVRFTTNTQAYLPPVFTRWECIEVMNYSALIYAIDQTDIAITGRGTLDGQGQAWHGWKTLQGDDVRRLEAMGKAGVPVAQRVFGGGHYLRPNFIQPVRCRNVLIEGVTVLNSPMWVLHPIYCTNVTLRTVTVTGQGPNTDGCDPDSCTDVWIKDCTFSNGDDCIAVKSGRNHDGRRVNLPCQNVVIQDCVFKDGHGGVTLGSETSGGIRRVFAENCRFDSPNLDMALRFKTGLARGGFIEDIHIRHCTVQTAGVGIHMTMRYSGTSEGDTVPVVRNIEIRDTTFARLLKQPLFIEGLSPEGQITDVTIADCTFTQAAKSLVITNAARIQLLNTTINGVRQ